MSVLSFSGLSKEYGGQYVFTHLSGAVEESSAIGMVGPNGMGKTTLIRILAGRLEESEGDVSHRRGLRIGYLQQEALDAFAERNNTLWEEMLTVFGPLKEKQAELNRFEARLSEDDDPALLERYGEKLQAFEEAGGYDYELKIKKTLEGLGFPEKDWSMPLSHCSGGQKTRALLGRLILEEPDLLILDEPTNHLDARATEWLETLLIGWDKALFIVSHDRYFLDAVAREIWELSEYGLEKFKGNYSAYRKQRAERRERRQKQFDATLEFFFKEMDYIRRFIDKKTTQAKGRLKRLVRHVKAVEIGGPEALDMKWNVFCLESGGVSSTKWSVNETEAHIRALRVRNPYAKPMAMRIGCTGVLPDKVLETENLKIGYGEKVLFALDKASLAGGERVALIGPNGCGKSTFLKCLLGELPPLSGRLELRESVRPAYFAQAHDILNRENTVLEELMSRKPAMKEGEARSYLGRYLFSGDDVYKCVHMLSGGERGRLTLAVLALEDVNFLILDEPTNHLDIQSREILEEALLKFPGAILFVAHDRYLIDRLATRVWSVESGGLNQFKGNYREYRAFLAGEREKRENRPRGAKGSVNRTVRNNRKKEIGEIEEAIVQLEEEVFRLEKNLETTVADGLQEEIGPWKEAYLARKEEIDDLLDRWEELSRERGGLGGKKGSERDSSGNGSRCPAARR